MTRRAGSIGARLAAAGLALLFCGAAAAGEALAADVAFTCMSVLGAKKDEAPPPPDARQPCSITNTR